jgi:hypothetical protein
MELVRYAILNSPLTEKTFETEGRQALPCTPGISGNISSVLLIANDNDRIKN